MAPLPIEVRAMADDDLVAARPLLAQLGYAVDAADLARRFTTVQRAADHALFVARSGNQIIGLLHVYARPAIERPTEAVVQSLVVDATRRKSGIGSILMDTAERWAAARGLTTVALSSNIVRTEAHAFYQGRGYAIAATSHVFRKTIGA